MTTALRELPICFDKQTTGCSLELQRQLSMWGNAESWSFPDGSVIKKSTCKVGDLGSISGLGRSLGGGQGNTFPVFLPRESHRQRNLAGFMGSQRVGHNWSNWAGKHTESCPTHKLSLEWFRKHRQKKRGKFWEPLVSPALCWMFSQFFHLSINCQ